MKKSPLVSLVVLVGFVCSCVDVPETPTTYFDTMKVRKSTETLTYSFSAKLKGKQDVNIMPRISGTLTQVSVSEGQKVSAGQVLFVIDQKPYQLQLQTAQANLLAAKTQLSTAQINYESTKGLFDKGIISKYVLETSENSYKNAQAAVALAESQVASASNDLSYCSVTSPASGVVGSVNVRVGDLVGPSMPTAMTTVSDNSVMEAYSSVPESQYLNLLNSQQELFSDKSFVDLFPPATLKLKSGEIYPVQGKLISFSGVVDPTTGSVSVKTAFDNPDGVLRSGISGSVLFSFEEDDMMVIPLTAVNTIQDKSLVYVLQPDSTVKATVIMTQDMNDGKNCCVLEGLKVGDEIITLGVNNIADGQRVSVRQDKSK